MSEDGGRQILYYRNIFLSSSVVHHSLEKCRHRSFARSTFDRPLVLVCNTTEDCSGEDLDIYVHGLRKTVYVPTNGYEDHEFLSSALAACSDVVEDAKWCCKVPYREAWTGPAPFYKLYLKSVYVNKSKIRAAFKISEKIDIGDSCLGLYTKWMTSEEALPMGKVSVPNHQSSVFYKDVWFGCQQRKMMSVDPSTFCAEMIEKYAMESFQVLTIVVGNYFDQYPPVGPTEMTRREEKAAVLAPFLFFLDPQIKKSKRIHRLLSVGKLDPCTKDVDSVFFALGTTLCHARGALKNGGQKLHCLMRRHIGGFLFTSASWHLISKQISAPM